jgi:hypothetical protein
MTFRKFGIVTEVDFPVEDSISPTYGFVTFSPLRTPNETELDWRIIQAVDPPMIGSGSRRVHSTLWTLALIGSNLLDTYV